MNNLLATQIEDNPVSPAKTEYFNFQLFAEGFHAQKTQPLMEAICSAKAHFRCKQIASAFYDCVSAVAV